MVVTCLLIGCNTLRRQLYITALIDSPLCRRCGAGRKTSVRVSCECEALVTLILTWVSFCWNPRMLDVWGESGTSLKERGSHELDIILRGTKILSMA